ncbi:hypothetical protein H4Q32_028399 [Labeo rohita]|uniref:Uncharacterized protein n=1 Tax=Labeo rohita TaxID=84645 RepID=A0ABQ8LB40_LABRO|nr:hypothetical protein H4Q32_028399 [Labeo rohita]
MHNAGYTQALHWTDQHNNTYTTLGRFAIMLWYYCTLELMTLQVEPLHQSSSNE